MRMLTSIDDEEMYEDGYEDEEMEFEEEMDDDDEDNVSEEDPDIEAMGGIEGLSGDIGIEIEMSDDDEEEDSNEDEDEDMDDEDVDDDARIEIVEDDGTGEGGDEDDWESHDEDEEDYEAQAEAEDEAHEMDHVRANNAHLVPMIQALTEDDPQTAAEMLRRMEEEGLDPADLGLEGYMDENMDEDGMGILVDWNENLLLTGLEDDEEEDDEMDDEMYGEYAGMYSFPLEYLLPNIFFRWSNSPPNWGIRLGSRSCRTISNHAWKPFPPWFPTPISFLARRTS